MILQREGEREFVSVAKKGIMIFSKTVSMFFFKLCTNCQYVVYEKKKIKLDDMTENVTNFSTRSK